MKKLILFVIGFLLVIGLVNSSGPLNWMWNTYPKGTEVYFYFVCVNERTLYVTYPNETTTLYYRCGLENEYNFTFNFAEEGTYNFTSYQPNGELYAEDLYHIKGTGLEQSFVTKTEYNSFKNQVNTWINNLQTQVSELRMLVCSLGVCETNPQPSKNRPNMVE